MWAAIVELIWYIICDALDLRAIVSLCEVDGGLSESESDDLREVAGDEAADSKSITR